MAAFATEISYRCPEHTTYNAATLCKYTRRRRIDSLCSSNSLCAYCTFSCSLHSSEPVALQYSSVQADAKNVSQQQRIQRVDLLLFIFFVFVVIFGWLSPEYRRCGHQVESVGDGQTGLIGAFATFAKHKKYRKSKKTVEKFVLKIVLIFRCLKINISCR